MLGDRITGRVVHAKKPGPKSYLTKRIYRFFGLYSTLKAGYRKSRKQVMLKTKACWKQIVNCKRGGAIILWKHKVTFTLCKSDPIASVRMECAYMTDYFMKLKDVMTKEEY